MDAVKALRKAMDKSKAIAAGTVVKFDVSYNSTADTIYHYAAISLGDGRWATTGSGTTKIGHYMSETELMQLLANNGNSGFAVFNIAVATGWENI